MTSKKCSMVVKKFNGQDKQICFKTPMKRSLAACIAHQLIANGEVKTFGEGIARGWEEVKSFCKEEKE